MMIAVIKLYAESLFTDKHSLALWSKHCFVDLTVLVLVF
jgi:hypothetical protein